VVTVDRPLGLSEILAETIRIYGERLWGALGIGCIVAAAFLVGVVTHPIAYVAVVSVAFTAAWAAATRLVSGDGLSEAWAQVALQLPVLLVLTLVVSVPVAVALSQLFLILLAVAWLAFVGFSIPVAVTEREEARPLWYQRLGFALHRAIVLARVEYLHAAGVAAALVLIVLLLGIVLAAALRGWADNGQLAAAALAQIVLAPFFFIGLSVLYFEQRVRALSSSRHDP
jgi:hypothetical protein